MAGRELDTLCGYEVKLGVGLVWVRQYSSDFGKYFLIGRRTGNAQDFRVAL
jgi:hypothetical protein